MIGTRCRTLAAQKDNKLENQPDFPSDHFVHGSGTVLSSGDRQNQNCPCCILHLSGCPSFEGTHFGLVCKGTPKGNFPWIPYSETHPIYSPPPIAVYSISLVEDPPLKLWFMCGVGDSLKLHRRIFTTALRDLYRDMYRIPKHQCREKHHAAVFRELQLSTGCGSKPCTPGEHQNRRQMGIFRGPGRSPPPPFSRWPKPKPPRRPALARVSSGKSSRKWEVLPKNKVPCTCRRIWTPWMSACRLVSLTDSSHGNGNRFFCGPRNCE